MKKNILTICLLAGLLCGYTPSTQAIEWDNKTTLFVGISALLAPYIYKCCTKEDPLERYNLDDLYAGKDILKNLYYLYLDGFIGTPEKNEAFKIKGKEGGKLSIKPRPKREATGVIGTIHANSKHVLKISAWLAALWAAINYSKDGIDVRILAKLVKI